jgi:hypothetical protein
MKFIRFTQIAALLVLVAGSARAADAWAQLKLGMTSIQAVAVVGAPLQRSSGQGFQVWTYDNRAELVFYGPLIGWTEPHIAEATARSVDVWQNSANAKTTKRYTLPHPFSLDKPVATRTEVVQTSFLPAYRRRY